MQLHADIRNYRRKISLLLFFFLNPVLRLHQKCGWSKMHRNQIVHIQSQCTAKHPGATRMISAKHILLLYCISFSEPCRFLMRRCGTKQNTPQYGHSCRYYKTYQLHSIALHYHQQMAQCARWPKPVQTSRKNILSTAGQFVEDHHIRNIRKLSNVSNCSGFRSVYIVLHVL